MFDLAPTDAQRDAVDALRALRGPIREAAREADAAGAIGRELRAGILSAARATPAELAGDRALIADPVALVLIAEELGGSDAGIAMAVLARAMADGLVAAAGGAPGSEAASLALYEGFGRSPSEFRSQVTSDGAVLSLSGCKDTVVGARAAESLIVCARGEDGHLGLFRGPSSGPGVEIERDDAEAGTLALGAAATARVRFDGARVERMNLGSEGATAARAVAMARLVVPAIAIGVGQAAVDTTAEWVSGRRVRGAALGANQGVTFPLVDADIAVSRARLLLWDVATELADRADATEIEHRVSRAVAIGCTAGSVAARVACNTMGWRGLSQRFDAEMRYRDTSVLSAIDFDPLQHGVPVLEAV